MAFCTGCGNKIEDAARFCPSCGTPAAGTAAQAPAVPTTAAAPAPAPYAAPPRAAAPAQGSSALKIILIVVGIIVVAFVLLASVIGYGAYKASKAIRAAAGGNSASLNMPFGKITAGEQGSAFKVAKELGIEVYPGATPLDASASSVTIGQMSVGGAEFMTNDPLEKVGEFYRAKYPNPKFNSKDANAEVIMLEGPRGMITINLETTSEGGTKISMAHINAPKVQ